MTPNTPKDSCAPLDLSLLTYEERRKYQRLTTDNTLRYGQWSCMAEDLVRSLITARSELKAERERNAALVEALGKIRDFTRKSGINEETRAVFAMTDMREIARAALSQSTQEKE